MPHWSQLCASGIQPHIENPESLIWRAVWLPHMFSTRQLLLQACPVVSDECVFSSIRLLFGNYRITLLSLYPPRKWISNQLTGALVPCIKPL